jgi:hypothetical protein
MLDNEVIEQLSLDRNVADAKWLLGKKSNEVYKLGELLIEYANTIIQVGTDLKSYSAKMDGVVDLIKTDMNASDVRDSVEKHMRSVITIRKFEITQNSIIDELDEVGYLKSFDKAYKEELDHIFVMLEESEKLG